MLENVLVPKDYKLREAFGIDVSDEVVVGGFAIPRTETLSDPEDRKLADFLRAAIPPIDPHHVFTMDVLRVMTSWWSDEEDEVLHLYGPTGSGKTSTPEQFWGRIGVPCLSVRGHRQFEAHEAFGHYIQGPNGQTVFARGPITIGAQYGVPVIINEYDRIQPSRAIVFNDVFEGRAFPLPGKNGEMLTPLPGFKVCVTTNTNLVEDLTGNYNTASVHDTSVLERLCSFRLDYLPEAQEVAVLAAVCKEADDDLFQLWFDQEEMTIETSVGQKQGMAISRDEFLMAMVSWANTVRTQSKDGGNAEDNALERTISTRLLRKMLRFCLRNIPLLETTGMSLLHTALARYISSKATESTRIALHSSIETSFGVHPKLP